MRIRLILERVWKQIHSGLLSSKLEQIAGDRGPVSYRTPEFLDAETKLGLALADLAQIEYEIGKPEAAEQAHARAEQIHIALRRFLPHADLEEADRATLERRLERLKAAMAKLSGLTTAA